MLYTGLLFWSTPNSSFETDLLSNLKILSYLLTEIEVSYVSENIRKWRYDLSWLALISQTIYDCKLKSNGQGWQANYVAHSFLINVVQYCIEATSEV